MNTLNCTISDKVELYRRYMAFIVGGGLFIPTMERYVMGETVAIQVSLFNEVFHVKGKIVWLVPEGATHYKYSGVGIQFVELEAEELKKKIKLYLQDPELEQIKDKVEPYTFP